MSTPLAVTIEEGDTVTVDVIIDDLQTVVDIGSVNQVWVQVTQAQYDALVTKVPSTLYIVVG